MLTEGNGLRFTDYTYDSHRDPASVTVGLRTTDFQYDALDRLVLTIGPDAGTGQGRPTPQIAYDQNGNVVRSFDPLGYVASPQYFTETHYDRMNRPDRVTQSVPFGSSSSTQTAAYSTIVYDATGNIETQTDVRGNSTENFYDERNQLIE
jgi:hypothetical protein